MMKALVLVLFFVTLGFAEDFLPIKVSGVQNDEKIFECYLMNTVGRFNPFDSGRKDDACKTFPANLARFREIELSVDMAGLDNIQAFKEFAGKHKANIKRLFWNIYGDYEPTLQNYQDVFNSVPNLKNLELSGWSKPLTVSGSGTFQLGNLKTLYFHSSHPTMLNLFTGFLPRDVLDEFIWYPFEISFTPDVISQFLRTQKKIQKIQIKDFPISSANTFRSVRLTKISFDFDLDKRYADQKTFLREIIVLHPQLTDLELGGYLGHYDHIDDALFDDICNLQELESLEIALDRVSETDIYKISNLKKLKKLGVKGATAGFSSKIKEVSELKMPLVESLLLHFPKFIIEAKTLQKITQSYPNLKSLIIYGTDQKINFFMKTFPNLKSLEIHHSEKGNRRSIEDSFISEASTHQNLKSLKWHFGNQYTIIDTISFVKLLNAFPNLEMLKIKARFPFEESFFRSLMKNLGRISNLELDNFVIACNENFEIEKLHILLELKQVVESLTLKLDNLVEPLYDDDRRDSCYFITDGELDRRATTMKDAEFSYDRLVAELKNDFVMYYDDRNVFKKTKKMTLEGGTKKHLFTS